MRKQIFLLLLFFFSSFGFANGQDAYQEATEYLKSFEYFEADSSAKTFLSELDIQTSDSLELIISDNPMPAQFAWFYRTISQLNACNPTQLTGNQLLDTLITVDKKMGSPESFNWFESSTSVENPNFIVFYSEKWENLFSAELFVFEKRKNTFKDYSSFNSGLLFLFCASQDGTVSPIYIEEIAHN